METGKWKIVIGDGIASRSLINISGLRLTILSSQFTIYPILLGITIVSDLQPVFHFIVDLIE